MLNHSYLFWANGKLRTTRDATWSKCAVFALQSPLRFSLLAVLALLATSVAVLQIGYASNDDVVMTMIVSGKALCPAPDEHLIFTNVIIGSALKQLYLAAPSFPWYGVYLLVSHWAAQTAILFCALLIGRPTKGTVASESPDDSQIGPRLGLYLLYFLLVEVPFLNQLQFTSTAFVAVQAGIFLWLLAWQRRTLDAQSPVVGPLCAAVALLVLGSAIRWESMAMAALVALPLPLVFFRKSSRAAWLPCGIAALTTAGLVAGTFAFDVWTYESDPNWRGFRQQHQARRIFHDLRWIEYTADTADIFAQVGWSANDRAMIENWFFDDPQVYSEANMRTIADSIPWSSTRLSADLWWQAFRDITRHRAVLSIWLVLPFVLGVVAEKRARVAIVATMLVAIKIVILVTWLQKLPPERVFFPLMSFPLSVALLSFAWRRGSADLRQARPARQASRQSFLSSATWLSGWQWRSTVVGLLVVAVVMSLLHQLKQSSKIEQGRVALYKFLDELHLDEGKLYVAWGAALPLELISPWDNLSAWSRIRVLSLGWPTGAPWYEKTKREFGITNLARALCERNDIVIIACPTHLELFTTFAREHFRESIEFVTNRQVGTLYLAGNFQTGGLAINDASKPMRVAQNAPRFVALRSDYATTRATRRETPRIAVR